MAQNVTLYNLLISCPGDIKEEVALIESAVEEFNELYAEPLGITIKTRHWSKSSYAQSGGKPQALLNEQFVNKCDAAVAIFWTRFGSPTDEYGSGTEEEIEMFYQVNLNGTKNLCAGLEKAGVPTNFIFISTVAVYGMDTGENISESAELKGCTPYALSKIHAEQFLQGWCEENSVKLSILRLPLIAGANPPGNLGAMINGIKRGRYFSIGDADARKSIVMAVDVARLLPALDGKIGVYNLSDGYDPSFGELEMLIARMHGKRKPYSIPLWLARLIARCGDLMGRHAPINSYKLDKIVKPLTFSSKKAQTELGWKPLRVLDNFKIS